MIKIAYCNVEDLDLKKAYNLVPKERQEKIDFFRFEKDKKLSAGAYLLLKKLLYEENIIDFELKYEKYDKPYISNYENIHFNMSHSGKMVSCAISDNLVGIDIEINDPTIDLRIAENYFYNSEYESIMNSDNPRDEFFSYWVLKESYMKYTGLGFQLNLDSFEIIINDEIKLKDDVDYGEHIKFNLFDLDGYKLAIASKYDVNDIIEYGVDELY